MEEKMEGLIGLLETTYAMIAAYESADFDYLDILVAHAKQELGEFVEKHNLKGTDDKVLLHVGPTRQPS